MIKNFGHLVDRLKVNLCSKVEHTGYHWSDSRSFTLVTTGWTQGQAYWLPVVEHTIRHTGYHWSNTLSETLVTTSRTHGQTHWLLLVGYTIKLAGYHWSETRSDTLGTLPKWKKFTLIASPAYGWSEIPTHSRREPWVWG